MKPQLLRGSKAKFFRRPKGKTLKLGYETIYPQQDTIAQKVMAVIACNRLPGTAHKRTPVIACQMQQGKTGAAIATMYYFIKDCIARNKTFQVVVLSGLAYLDLLKQTKDRMFEGTASDGLTRIGAQLDIMARQSGLVQGYPKEHAASGILISNNSVLLKDLELGPVDERLIVIDEVHLGNVKGGNLDVCLRKLGIKISEQMHTWGLKGDRANNHVVGISATPFAHSINSELMALQGNALFEIVYLEPTKEYNSISKMLTNGRLKQTELFQPSFLREVESEFLKNCKKHGAGYLVIRAAGKANDQLMNYINRHGANIEVKEFDADNDNLDELNNFLSQRPKHPTWVVIRGGMRAGITLGSKHFIRGWVENKSTNADSQVQSGVGRACGYGRTNDTYPIYCDLKQVAEVARYYEELATGAVSNNPKGCQNKAAKAKKFYVIDRIVPHEEARRIRDKEIKIGNGKKHSRQLYTTKGNRTICSFLMNGQRDSSTTIGVIINGPNPKAPGAYAKLIKLHPNWKDKAVIFKETTVLKTDSTVNRNTFSRKRSALQKDA